MKTFMVAVVAMAAACSIEPQMAVDPVWPSATTQGPHIALPEIRASPKPLGPPAPVVKAPPLDPNPSGLVLVSMYWKPQPTASGRKFRPWSEHTCAHKSLPFGTRVLIEYLPTKKRVWVEVTDRGPYVGQRKLDLTPYTYDALRIPRGNIVHVRVLWIAPPRKRSNQ